MGEELIVDVDSLTAAGKTLQAEARHVMDPITAHGESILYQPGMDQFLDHLCRPVTSAIEAAFKETTARAMEISRSLQGLGLFANLAGQGYLDQDSLTQADIRNALDGRPGQDPLAPPKGRATTDSRIITDAAGHYGIDFDGDGTVDEKLDKLPEPPPTTPSREKSGYATPKARGMLDPWWDELQRQRNP